MEKHKRIPKLEKRGKYWEYRLRVSGKLERVSTSKEDFQEARKILEEVIEKCNLIKSEAIDKISRERLLAHEYGAGDIPLDMGVLRGRAGKDNSQGNL